MLSKSALYRTCGSLISAGLFAVVALAAPAPALADPVATSPASVASRKPIIRVTAAAEAASKAHDGGTRAAADSLGSDGSTAETGILATTFKELQLNLCNSGYASCYSGGRAVDEAGEKIRYYKPNVVTLNEICQNDLDSLEQWLGGTWLQGWIYWAFYPAWKNSTNGPYLCKNGYQYGNAVLGYIPDDKYQGVNAWSGIYTAQDSTDEDRTFVCANAIGDHFACATHLASGNEPLALSQCRALLFDAVPYIKSQEGVSGKTIVGGDLNLDYDTADPENVQLCVPNGYTRKGDNGVQHVMFTNDFTFVSTYKTAMVYTDHPAFGVQLSRP